MWGRHRKALIIAMLLIVAGFIVAVTLIATLYKAPSCTDNSQNQGETGVDCGGPCSHLCTPSEVSAQVLFVRALAQQSGRTDVIAYIANKNADAAAKNVPFTATLYASDGTLIATKQGTVDLPPASTVPVFIPGLYSGFQQAAHAFLTIDDASVYWYRYTDVRPVLSTSDVVLTPGNAPRATATVANPTPYPLLNLPVVITVFDASNNAIAASRTVVDEVPPQGSASMIFTWNQPFSAAAAREEVVPLVPLP
ncbi:MAG TPA: hypothetical protein VHB93_01990 [Candidatus Paceibacterota bacterium]|nr:hypothetical protein [Candidatus Paceibacterota bacterium]